VTDGRFVASGATYLNTDRSSEYIPVETIRIGTKALSFWPYRLLAGPEADSLLRLLERLTAAGKHVALMLHLSHPAELKTDAGRVITLHLRGKTEGQQQFAISLAGPGVKATNAWTVPQLVLREASKQRGALLIVPEQGMRLQVATRDGLTQLDPQKSGIRQKGVLAFRAKARKIERLKAARAAIKARIVVTSGRTHNRGLR